MLDGASELGSLIALMCLTDGQALINVGGVGGEAGETLTKFTFASQKTRLMKNSCHRTPNPTHTLYTYEFIFILKAPAREFLLI
jgi:hypothetical protein